LKQLDRYISLPRIKNEILFSYYLFTGFGRSALYKFTGDMSRVSLPAPSTAAQLWDETDRLFVKKIMGRVDKLVNMLVHFTTRKCFYRAYTSAYILRKNGIAVTLNIGLHHLHKDDRSVRGHSWLSWRDQPLEEDSDPRIRYSRFLGTGRNGVCYWLGGDKTDKRKIVRYRTATEGFNKNAALGN